jgi:serine phosphatase RsbU (regulator of sigma subunit)/predicted ester cyclase
VSTGRKYVGLAVEEEAPMASEEEKDKALVRRFLEAHAKGDLGAMEEMLAPDFVDHNLIPGQRPGREGYLHSTAEYHAAYSHTRYVIEKQLAEGDEVVTTFAARATHDQGEWMGLVPTGKEFEALLVLIHRIVGGKIAEEWSQGSGLAELTQQRLEQERIERERIEQELRVARSIQQASLPKDVPTLESWQITPYYQPAREVGGDFYDFHVLSGGRLGVVVGDATGKGVPAALVMSTTCGMLQLAARALDSPSPGEVLAQVNETLLARIPSNMFVTCFYAVLNPKRGHLVYANAGHDLPYLQHGGEAKELRARGMPLGLMPASSYEENEIVIDAGESVLFYSDGLVEAHDPEGQMFSFPRLRALVAKHTWEGALGEYLLEKLYSFVGEGWEQEDDITLITLRCSSSLS